jgi:hypothetical protein
MSGWSRCALRSGFKLLMRKEIIIFKSIELQLLCEVLLYLDDSDAAMEQAQVP